MAIIKPTLNLVASEYTPEILNVTRASGATRVNAAGLVERVSAGTLRYDHDPTTLAGKGWLVEEARSNLCLQSEDFGTTWAVPAAPTAATITTNTTTAPDGNTTADTMTVNNTTDHPCYQDLTIVNDSNDVTNSIFVKQPASGGLTEVRLQIYMSGGTAKSGYCNYVFATGVASAVSDADSVTVTEFPDGWFRITATMANNSTGNTTNRIAISMGGTSETGDVYIWGGQMEAGSFAASYIPTTTAAVTRSEDSVSVPLSDFDFNFNEQTIYLQSTATAFNGMAALAVYLNGSNTVSFFVNPTTTLRTHRQTSGLQGNLDFTKAAGIEFRAALSIAQDDVAFSVDGETPELDTGHNMNSTLTTVWLGSNGATSPYSGYISHVAIFNKAMSDADIQTITTG